MNVASPGSLAAMRFISEQNVPADDALFTTIEQLLLETGGIELLLLIERDINKNVVVYALDQGEVHVFWVMIPAGADMYTEELTTLEKMYAYGIREVTPDNYLYIEALPQEPLRIHPENGRFVVSLMVNGRETVVRRISLVTDGRLSTKQLSLHSPGVTYTFSFNV